MTSYLGPPCDGIAVGDCFGALTVVQIGETTCLCECVCGRRVRKAHDGLMVYHHKPDRSWGAKRREKEEALSCGVC